MREGLRNLVLANLANLITTARLIFSVWLVTIAISSSNQLFLMFILVILCGTIDLADGWIARKYHIESRIGGFLDRLADKIFICPTIFILVYRFWPAVSINPTIRFLTTGLVVVIVLPEVFLILSGIVGFIKGLNTASNQWGRRKMVFQSVAVIIWFFSLNLEYYLKIKVLSVSIYLIDIILIVAVGLAVKSIEGYWQGWH